MSHIISVRNVNQAFREAWWWMRTAGFRQDSRNGPVLRSPGVFITEYSHPRERILWNPRRDCNPIFHLAECIWMMAGESYVSFLEPFNSNISQYADGDGTIWGAYGNRWRYGEYGDQLPAIVDILKKDSTSRRAVLQMWDSVQDLDTNHKDIPCNTHIYFEIIAEQLNMTVCNRSNDMLWGAYGANVVHMSFLQEVLAHEIGVQVGVYRQISNNFHVYLENEMVQNFLEVPPFEDYNFYTKDLPNIPILLEGETMADLIHDCEVIVSTDYELFKTSFIKNIAHPLLCAYLDRKDGLEYDVSDVPMCDWKLAFQQWCDRRK